MMCGLNVCLGDLGWLCGGGGCVIVCIGRCVCLYVDVV